MLAHCVNCGLKTVIFGICSGVLSYLLFWLIQMQLESVGNIPHIPNAAYILDIILVLSLFASNYLMVSSLYHMRDYK